MGLIPGPLSQPGRLRVIRRGQYPQAGRFKWAIDYRLNGARVQRVKARGTRDCAAGSSCRFRGAITEGWIQAGTEYVKVHANEGRPKIIRGRAIYSPRDYHFECVPEVYQPMLRFIR